MVAVRKKAEVPAGGVPDVRPVAIGEAERRVFDRAVMIDNLDALVDYLEPLQFMVGVRGGDSKLVHGLRMTMKAHPDWVFVQLDLKNAFNEIKREAVLQAFMAVLTLSHLVPFLRAVLAPEGPILMGEHEQPSAEGLQKGKVWGTACFCVGIHADVTQLSSDLSAIGGLACFGADDGYVGAPPC